MIETPKQVMEKAKLLSAIELRRQAAVSEFTAAALTGDQKEMNRLRDNLHTYLDAQLDQLAELMKITQ